MALHLLRFAVAASPAFLPRPPGHHAEPAMGGGYCLFNNVAIAALHALEQHQLERVAIVDFDVHHGNGTQAMFVEDPRVLFISVHQAGNYPLFSGENGDADTSVPLAGSSVGRSLKGWPCCGGLLML